jgi:hypothetical protein
MDGETYKVKGPSPTEKVGDAFNYMGRMLFKPFRLKFWLWLGLVAFIMDLTSGGCQVNVPSGGDMKELPPGARDAFRNMGRWAEANTEILIVIGAIAVLLAIVVGLLLLYLSCRFSFVFIDCVARNRVEIRESFRATREQGNSYFLWVMGITLIAILSFILLGGTIGLSVYLMSQSGKPSALGIIAIILVVLLFFVAIFALIFLNLFTSDFVLPIQYLKRIRILEAWANFYPYLRNNVGHFALYVLMKVVLGIAGGIAAGIAGLLVGCICCCLGGIPLGALFYGLIQTAGWSWGWLIVIVPTGIAFVLLLRYVLSVVVLPVPVFFRAYSLYVLETVGDEYLVLQRFQEERGF